MQHRSEERQGPRDCDHPDEGFRAQRTSKPKVSPTITNPVPSTNRKVSAATAQCLPVVDEQAHTVVDDLAQQPAPPPPSEATIGQGATTGVCPTACLASCGRRSCRPKRITLTRATEHPLLRAATKSSQTVASNPSPPIARPRRAHSEPLRQDVFVPWAGKTCTQVLRRPVWSGADHCDPGTGEARIRPHSVLTQDEVRRESSLGACHP